MPVGCGQELSQLGGHSRKRTHRAPPTHEGDPWPIGWVIMESVKAYASERHGEDITVLTGARVTGLSVEEDGDDEKLLGLKPRRSIKGVTYVTPSGETVQLQADAVVLATGGYGCDLTQDSLLQEYRPDLMEGLGSGRPMPSTNGGFATGDGVKLGREHAGAALVDMDKVQLHPTSFIDPKVTHRTATEGKKADRWTHKPTELLIHA
jgi:succinate dehydrogenase/fumarate reductase flavoprotein subunit